MSMQERKTAKWNNLCIHFIDNTHSNDFQPKTVFCIEIYWKFNRIVFTFHIFNWCESSRFWLWFLLLFLSLSLSFFHSIKFALICCWLCCCWWNVNEIFKFSFEIFYQEFMIWFICYFFQITNRSQFAQIFFLLISISVRFHIFWQMLQSYLY